MSEHTILLGACGWQHPHWVESYYPEGLPEDWQLAYYGNEYPVVLIPAGYWEKGRPAVDSWLQETGESPDFICEVNQDSEPQSAIDEMIAALGNRVKGVLIALTREPDDRQLAMMRELARLHPVSLDWPTAVPEQIDVLLNTRLAGIDVGVCWHGDVGKKATLKHGRLLMARVTCAGQTPKNLRTILETLLAHVGERQAVLLFDGQPPDLEVMHQAHVILELI